MTWISLLYHYTRQRPWEMRSHSGCLLCSNIWLHYPNKTLVFIVLVKYSMTCQEEDNYTLQLKLRNNRQHILCYFQVQEISSEIPKLGIQMFRFSQHFNSLRNKKTQNILKWDFFRKPVIYAHLIYPNNQREYDDVYMGSQNQSSPKCRPLETRPRSLIRQRSARDIGSSATDQSKIMHLYLLSTWQASGVSNTIFSQEPFKGGYWN